LRARTFGPIHVDGEAEHKSCGLAFGGEHQKPRRIGGKILARNGLDAGGQSPVGIARGDADGLGAEVKAYQRAPGRQVGRSPGMPAAARVEAAGFARVTTPVVGYDRESAQVAGGGAKKQRRVPSGRLQRQNSPSGEGWASLKGTDSYCCGPTPASGPWIIT